MGILFLTFSNDMIDLAKNIYRKTKYTFFTTREREFVRVHRQRRDKLISDYLKSHDLKKLQIGAESNSIGGWLNVDIHPKTNEVAYMDATEIFPFADDSLDYIFSEHMIEHVTFEGGKFMIKECFRTLKRGGKIRIATPDLAFLIQLYSKEKSAIQKRYIDFSIERYFKNQAPAFDTLVINNFMRDWGHQFVHDEKSLTYLLQEAGFQSIIQVNVGESNDLHFQNIEQHGKEITDDFNKLESIVMEAQKP
jgi:predicted SAM-dependent methyltransferase